MKRPSAVRAALMHRFLRAILRVEELESREAPSSLETASNPMGCEDPWVSDLAVVQQLDEQSLARARAGIHEEVASALDGSPSFVTHVGSPTYATESGRSEEPSRTAAPAIVSAAVGSWTPLELFQLDVDEIDALLASAFEDWSAAGRSVRPAFRGASADSLEPGQSLAAGAEGADRPAIGLAPPSSSPAAPAEAAIRPLSFDDDAAIALTAGLPAAGGMLATLQTARPVLASGAGSSAAGANLVPTVPADSVALQPQDAVRPPSLATSTSSPAGAARSGPVRTLEEGPSGGTDWPTGFPVPALPDESNCADSNPIETAWGLPRTEETFSEFPVRYFDGTVKLQVSSLGSEGYGKFWGHTLSWTNGAGYASTSFSGSGMVVSELPYLMQDATHVVAISDGTTARYFDKVGSVYNPRFYLQEQLTYNATPGEFVLTDTTGNSVTFLDFGAGRPANARGQFQSLKDPAGNVITVTSRTSDGKPAEVQRSTTVGGVTTIESLQYVYLTTGPNTGLLDKVTLRRKVGSGNFVDVRKEVFTYYAGEAYGNTGNLKLAVLQDGAGNVLDTQYFRWYTGEAGGYVGGLKYHFGHESYGRLLAAVPNPAGATDDLVAPFADHYFEYNGSKQVTKEVVQGAGCSSCFGGQGTFTYSYAANANPNGYNSYKYKTVESLPDGNENIIFSNFAGGVMVEAFHEVSSGRKWITFHQYDESTGREILMAHPSAVTGYDETKPDLLNNVSGNYQYLRDNAGLIEVTNYYASTTATETTPGGAAGYFQDRRLKQGETNPAILQESAQYFAHTGGGATVYPVASSTVYRNTDGTGAQTTSYSYTWLASSAQMQSMTVSLPVISSAQNGPGTADVQTIFVDTYSREIWRKDGEGFLHYTAYDPGTGAITKTITDVNTSLSADFTNLPAGWTTPAGGGLHLITQMEVDQLGRTTKLTRPNGNVTYTVYNDPNHEVRLYPGWDTTTNRSTGPTQVWREDRLGGYTEALTMSATPAVSNQRPDGTEAISSLETLARSYTNSGGQEVGRDAYFNLTGVTYSTALYLGTEGTHYHTTLMGYDERGRLNRVQTPTGTIQRTVYDGLDRPVSTWVGTFDTVASGSWSPSNRESPLNMVQVSANVYDGGGVGDGNLTQVTQYPGGTAAERVVQYFFDWRNRPVASKSGVQATETDTGTQRPIVFSDLDNLGQATAVSQYDGDGVTLTDANGDGVPDKPAASLLRAYRADDYDDQGRLFRTRTYSVDQSTGALSANWLTAAVWFDHRGQTIKTVQPGGLVFKQRYDGAGRLVKSFTTDGGGDTSWADAGTVTGDVVLSQMETQYDANSNAILVTSRERFHDEATTGELAGPTVAPKARVSYTAQYYDLADRPTASVDVGTNGGSAYVRPATVPARSDTVLVTGYSYSSAGWLSLVIDPRGIQLQTSHDRLGRVTQTIEGYTGGPPLGTSDRITQYAYDGSNHVVSVTAYVSGTSFQTTQYVFGVSTATGSDVNSNDLLAAIRYPDPVTGNASASQQELTTVNALGERKTMTDRNGTTHAYSYDVVGRPTADAILTLGTGVDGQVRRLETGYDSAGRPALFTSYNAASGGSVVNQVQRVYNGLGQLVTEYQATAGAVNPAWTPAVRYAYSEMAGGANHSRLVSMTYPSNSKVLSYNYAAGLDDRISRLSSLSDGTGTLEAYSYLGLDTVVQRSRPQPSVDMTYVKQGAEANGEAGDQYPGLDRFGRVVDQRWLKTSSGVATDRFVYGYDPNGNRLYRDNQVNPQFGELYHDNGAGAGYDLLNQLLAFRRGLLADNDSNGIPEVVVDPSVTRSWNYDVYSNWSSVNPLGPDAQTRAHNLQNEITAISNQVTPTYDTNGNTTRDERCTLYAFDAWNRLVSATPTSGSAVTYTVDALGRRVTESISSNLRELYYSADWQVLEEGRAYFPQAQYVWSPVYVDALVLRDRDAHGSRTPKERLWVQQDANWNVTALVDNTGNVAERYIFDPYGAPTVLAPDWTTRVSSLFAWNYLHQGGRYDGTSGLYHFRNRDYSANLGRWVQTDPLGFEAGDTNLYRYVQNSPLTWNDPSGLIWESISDNGQIGGRLPRITDPGVQALDCKGLAKALRELQNSIDSRKDDLDNYPRTHPRYKGHVDRIRQEEDLRKKLKDRYKDLGCDDPKPPCPDPAKPGSSQQQKPQPQSQPSQQPDRPTDFLPGAPKPGPRPPQPGSVPRPAPPRPVPIPIRPPAAIPPLWFIPDFLLEP